jgi:phage terminase large subunit
MSQQTRQIQFSDWTQDLFIMDKYRYKVTYGGRGGGKTTAYSDVLSTLIYNHRFKVMVFREFKNDLQHSVHNEIVCSLEKLGIIQFFDIFKEKITIKNCKNGSGFYFMGFAVNAESVKGLKGFKIIWIEEASTISVQAWELLKPSVREYNSEIWLSFNPKNLNDAVYLEFCGSRQHDDAWIRRVNYYDNPFFTDVLEKTRLADKHNLSADRYNHIWLGMVDLDQDDMLIPSHLIQAAIDSNIRDDQSPIIFGVDPARLGGDRFSICVRRGRSVIDFIVLPKSNLVDSAGRLSDLITKHNPRRVFIDVGGLGVGVYDILRGNNFKNVLSVNFGGTPLDNRKYYNKRAEMYGNALEWLTDPVGVSIRGNTQAVYDFMTEMCLVTKKFKPNGTMLLTPKDELKAKGYKSPDLADSFALTFAQPVANEALLDVNNMYNRHKAVAHGVGHLRL